jgi:hypothetical protein
MEPGWLAFRTVCWQKMRLKMRRLWSELVDGAVLGLEWILAILDLCLQIPSVAYMLFYQVPYWCRFLPCNRYLRL